MEEWSDGQFKPFRSLFLITFIVTLRIQQFSSMLRTFKIGRPETWNQFSLKVHLFSSHNGLDSLIQQRPLVYLSAGTVESYKVRMEIEVNGDDTE